MNMQYKLSDKYIIIIRYLGKETNNFSLKNTVVCFENNTVIKLIKLIIIMYS